MSTPDTMTFLVSPSWFDADGNPLPADTELGGIPTHTVLMNCMTYASPGSHCATNPVWELRRCV